MKNNQTIFFIILSVFILFAFNSLKAGQLNEDIDLTELSIEELMKIVITSVSKKVENLSYRLWGKFFNSEDQESIITGNQTNKDVNISIDTGIPCSLILNELISNSLKHAFPKKDFLSSDTAIKQNEITIKLYKESAEKISLLYKDNGVGLPEGFDFRKYRKPRIAAHSRACTAD